MALVLACPAEGAGAGEPSFRRGLARMIVGLLHELPMTIVESTKEGPVVIGTAVGLLGAVPGAWRSIVGGIAELASAFDPWGIKR